MEITYKSCDEYLFHNSNNSVLSEFDFGSKEEKNDIDLLTTMYQLLSSFQDFTNPFDFDNLLKTGHSIQSSLQHLDIDLYYKIFGNDNFLFLHTLLNLITNQETYSKNNDLIIIIFSIILEIIKSNDIDISMFSTNSFFDCLFDVSIPNIHQNDQLTSCLQVFTLINEIHKDNKTSIDIFIEESKFIAALISNFDAMNDEEQIMTCKIFTQIVSNFEIEFLNYESYESTSFPILKDFIEEKMFYFENQPFFVNDLITSSIKKEFVSLGNLVLDSTVVEEIIRESTNDKENSFKKLNSLLNVISAAFSTTIISEENEELISNFQWSFFKPFLQLISLKVEGENRQFDMIDSNFQMNICDTFSCIFKRGKKHALNCTRELNLLNILLDLASFSSEVSYKVKEASINALMNLAIADPRLVFVTYEKGDFTLNNNYLLALIEFLESNSNDNFLQSVIKSIICIKNWAEDEVISNKNPQEILETEKSKKEAFNRLVNEFIVSSLLENEEIISAKIESAFENINMSNVECQKLLLSLQRHLQRFYELTKQK